MISLTDLSTVLLLGYGREGHSTHRFLRDHGFTGQLSIYDLHPLAALDQTLASRLKSDPGVHYHFGPDMAACFHRDYDLIVKTPGIANQLIPSHLLPQITSATQLFFDYCPGMIIGVTGTKGKSTTSSLIAAMLAAGDLDVRLVGNIGTPALDHLDNIQPSTFVVFELSSHQLSLLRVSPHIAVILGIYPEHLDYYASFADYVAAKAQIVRYQRPTDYVVFDATNPTAATLGHSSAARQIPLTPQLIAPAAQLMVTSQLRGPMNAKNIAIATQVATLLGVNAQQIHTAVQSFHPLEHRLEFVGEFRRVRFYNDSLSTIPEATIAALETLGAEVETLLLGGYDRHLTYTQLASAIISRPHLRNLVFFPTTGPKIWQAILDLNPAAKSRYQIQFVDQMSDAVAFAYAHTSPGKICLMSPASTSFSLFKDYRDRGAQFKQQISLQAPPSP